MLAPFEWCVVTSFYQSLQAMSSFMRFSICATYFTLSRSVRAYKSESVPSKALDTVLEAGTYPAQEAGQPAARKQNYIVRI